MKNFLTVLVTLSLGLGSISCRKDSSDNDKAPTAPLALDFQSFNVKPLSATNFEDQCKALESFLTAYVQTYLPQTTLEFSKPDLMGCSNYSMTEMNRLESTFILRKDAEEIRYSYFFTSYVDEEGRYKYSNFSLSRIDQNNIEIENTTPSTVEIFGDKIKNLRPTLEVWSNCDDHDVLVFNQRALDVYKKFTKNFGPGNSRDFIVDPAIKAEFTPTSDFGGTVKILALDAKYFELHPFLDCTTSECLLDGLTYKFYGHRIVIISKPVVGEKGSTRSTTKTFLMTPSDIE
ncbi:MAG: hypothetical protein V4655_01170 [Bdellovibrionota bacterium]